jgi:hypothetical protein
MTPAEFVKGKGFRIDISRGHREFDLEYGE